jgi:ribulose-phosphate 3-epimerase
MPAICPSILASDSEQYRGQMEKVASFSERIQIDLTDGDFAKNRTIGPEEAWWPVGIKADFHLMYRQPHDAVDIILEHKPHMIIVHAEAEGNFLSIAEKLRPLGVKIGLAILPRTSAESIMQAVGRLDHVLIFSGNLGEYGGHANMDLLNKVHTLKQHKPDLEVGWDGGVSNRNISQLAMAGVDVFDVGGFLQQSADPQRDYFALKRIADETGTT